MLASELYVTSSRLLSFMVLVVYVFSWVGTAMYALRCFAAHLSVSCLMFGKEVAWALDCALHTCKGTLRLFRPVETRMILKMGIQALSGI